MTTYDLYENDVYVVTVDLHSYVNIDTYLKTAFPDKVNPRLVKREPRQWIKQYE